MNPSRQQSWSKIALVVGAPLLLAVVELFHLHPHDLLNLDKNLHGSLLRKASYTLTGTCPTERLLAKVIRRS